METESVPEPIGKLVKLTAYVSPELRRAAKTNVLRTDSSVSALVTRLLTEHLARETRE